MDKIDLSNNLNKKVFEELETVYSEGSIVEVRDVLERGFRDFYNEKRYIEVSAIPLLENKDDSVLFAGASISAIKDVLLNQDYPEGSNGIFLFQDCIRTGAKEYMFDNNWIPFGQIYFKMASNLSRPGRSLEVLDEAVEFLQKRISVKSNNIKILSSKNIQYFNDVDKYTSLDVEYDSREKSFYEWEYGIDGVRGEGLTVAIYNPKLEKWLEIGNIVVISDDDGNELGCEFGYGYEYFLTAIFQEDNPLKFSKVFDVFKYEEGLPLKYYYNLEAVANMKIAGAIIGDKGANNVFKNYIKSLQYIGESIGKTPEVILSDIDQYLSQIYGKRMGLGEESNFLKEYERRKQNFKNIVKRVGRFLWSVEHNQKPKEFIQDPVGMINYYLQQNGIERVEVENVLLKLKRFNVLENIN